MSPVRVLAVVTTPRPEPAPARELLRLLVALVASGAEVRLLAADPLALDDLPPDAQRLLDGLREFGVHGAALDAASLGRAAEDADHVVRLADRARDGAPAVLDLGTPDIEALAEAGQVLR